jgi:hypothetical protein
MYLCSKSFVKDCSPKRRNVLRLVKTRATYACAI